MADSVWWLIYRGRAEEGVVFVGIKHTLQSNTMLLTKAFRYNKMLLLLRICVAVLGSVSVILTILMPMYLLEAIIGGDIAQVIEVVVVFTVPFLLITLINVGFSAYDSVAREKIYVKIINELLQKTINLDLGYFDDTESYDKYNRAFSNCCKIIDSINGILTSFITSSLNAFFIVGLLIWIDVYMFMVIAAMITISFLVNNRLKRIDYDFNKLLTEKSKQVNYLYRLFYLPQFVREVKSNNLSDFVFTTKHEFNNKILELVHEQTRKKAPFNVLLGSLGVLESSLVALYFGFSVVARRIAVSEYFTCVSAYSQLKNAVLNLTGIYNQLYSNSLFAGDYIEFMKSEENVTWNKEGIKLKTIKKIEFKHVSFKYSSGNLVLNDVSFEITAGEKIAILGKNGAGKTTIIKLLLRLYDPQSGSILINDIDIKKYNTRSLREVVQTLFQDFAIYAFSIKDNITLGRDIDEVDVVDALRKVDMEKKVNSLSFSLDTPITSQLYPGGVEFSGGEAQKLAIARIYAAKPKIFVMDEPTSNLDPYAEYQLYKRLMDDIELDSTAIIISHRLTLTYKMSKIIVIEQGRVIEQGNHNELMCLRGRYFEMYNIQTEKYIANAK